MNKKDRRTTRHMKVRKRVFGTKDKPRLSVFRSNKNIYAQLIDDHQASTLVGISTVKMKDMKDNDPQKSKKFDQAKKVGDEIAKIAIKKKIKKVVFDRGGFKYHGRIKALAEAAKKGGLNF
ncbi:50S ribosomal protein L18 [Candidatus Curtissbacteria bacterium RIFCSPLOWO2_01_FULL_39_62]|uniref:Large ribosomal subunit protein uL18 n=2 Tax=Candidatus Curtissiibacteriota TaxID=1752717 RepID=A0A1F5G7L8_9BACT|nr:MAG: 50S ribosomal protein L18 [Candidatus Curtissbacteria bacterium RIFCSPHIGHO2_01_FULL_39_57]OGD87815.1 MAG: 50S ribosomal protein L18 [Candidatus Curtissbacteria bacterium RIFCSPHIGHO2_02_FULL_40_16b]OGD90568.1 MAG: 50S ribosomal protein L18 [Candidatus Curtissbacteria bacterium RIFCSPHIGHO2_12_FULL_38_37]OGD99815.1 MAG: 50S ribosomal protein L18 [Candidatus Curtissbacteria bacterium RIFCSPLOWO2_02_FULL_40_11]OGE01079.1 MAG: 50S ribosomal protein L18 [Candidatus Curtissbacteria bacterium